MTEPIERGRYGSQPMRELFGDQARFRFFVQVEGVLARVQARYGAIPQAAGDAIYARSLVHRCDLERIQQFEADTHHELFAVVREFAEHCGPNGRYVHHGVTSSDILDTALALQIDRALGLLDEALRELMGASVEAIHRHGHHVLVGLTHGQHAQPVTLGFKLAIWLDQLGRCLQRLGEVRNRSVMGKVGGAVGSLASLGEHALRIQRDVLAELGLPAPEIAAQAVARDRMAEVVCWAGLTAACMETMATEVRNLQRTEIGEVGEAFAEGDQIGSSAMPHKRNPVRCETVCSLARLVRALIGPALENVVTWHERDLANSANERFTLPQSCILLEHMLTTMASVVSRLRVDPDRMADNLARSGRSYLSEQILLLMVDRGMERLTAYRLLQDVSRSAGSYGGDLVTALRADPRVQPLLTDAELADLTARADTGYCTELAAQTTERTSASLGERVRA